MIEPATKGRCPQDRKLMCYPSKPELILRLDQDTKCLDHAHREENVEKEISDLLVIGPPLLAKKERRS